MQTGIYRIHNTVTGAKYVGSAVNIPRRWRAHKLALRKGVHHSRFLQRAWNKYGAAAFVFSVVGYCCKSELLKFEQRAIDASAPAFNMSPTAGSPLGIKHSAESRANMRAAHLGKQLTAEQRAKIAAANRGRRHSATTRAKMSAARQGWRPTAVTRAKMSASAKIRPPANLGKHFSQAVRDNMGRARAAFSDDQVRGIRAAVMAGWSQRDVAQLLDVVPGTVGQIHNRTAYKWVT